MLLSRKWLLAGILGFSLAWSSGVQAEQAPAQSAQSVQIQMVGEVAQRTRSRPAPRTAPRAAPRATPRAAPRAAPRTAPRSAPRTAPRAAPRSAPRTAPRVAPRTAPRAPARVQTPNASNRTWRPNTVPNRGVRADNRNQHAYPRDQRGNRAVAPSMRADGVYVPPELRGSQATRDINNAAQRWPGTSNIYVPRQDQYPTARPYPIDRQNSRRHYAYPRTISNSVPTRYYRDYRVRRNHRPYYLSAIPFASYGYYAAVPYGMGWWNSPFLAWNGWGPGLGLNYLNVNVNNVQQPDVYPQEDELVPQSLEDRYRPAPEELSAAPSGNLAPSSIEEALLLEVSSYVAERSVDEAFYLPDPAFEGRAWQLDLVQAPAVFSIDENAYSVVTGFEGVLEGNTIPAQVGVEFFLSREGDQWKVLDAWIVSANGIFREKRYRSPVYPGVQTWNEGETCPFSGRAMIPISSADDQ